MGIRHRAVAAPEVKKSEDVVLILADAVREMPEAGLMLDLGKTQFRRGGRRCWVVL